MDRKMGKRSPQRPGIDHLPDLNNCPEFIFNLIK